MPGGGQMETVNGLAKLCLAVDGFGRSAGNVTSEDDGGGGGIFC